METLPLIFLRIELEEGGLVKGSSLIGRYESRIMIDSFTFKMSNSEGKVRQTGQAAGSRVHLDDVSISKPFDRSSIELARLAKNRERFTEARLTVDQHKVWSRPVHGQEREQNAIIVFHLLHGFIRELKWNASESGKAASVKETLELTFKQVEIEYYSLDWEASTREGQTLRKDAPHPFSYLPEIDDEI